MPVLAQCTVAIAPTKKEIGQPILLPATRRYLALGYDLLRILQMHPARCYIGHFCKSIAAYMVYLNHDSSLKAS